MSQGFIYLWTNNINGKKYIGSHIGNINDGYIGSGVAFNRAIIKYGIDNFKREIIEYVDKKEDVLIREQYYIDLYDAANSKQFYNIKPKAGGGFEFINSIPEIRKNNIDRLKTIWKHLPHPKGHSGKVHSEEVKRKISESSKKSAKHRKYNRSKPILQFDLYGNYIAKYDSIADAARAVNGNGSNIKYTAEGKFKKAYNYVWKYDASVE